MNIDTDNVHAILKHFGIQIGSPADTGTAVAISGETTPERGKTLEFGGVRRMIPLGDAGATVLAEQLHGALHHEKNESALRMLEHLLLRCSEMFEDSGISAFHLDVRLRSNFYAVVDATMTAASPLHFKKRLSAHAHDNKGTGYRPAGRQ